MNQHQNIVLIEYFTKYFNTLKYLTYFTLHRIYIHLSYFTKTPWFGACLSQIPLDSRSCCCCSVAKSCPALCDPMDCSMPSSPVLHHLPELAQTHAHRVGDATQPSHPLLPTSPLAFSLPQHQGLSCESALCIRWPKYWSFSISSSNEYSALISTSYPTSTNPRSSSLSAKLSSRTSLTIVFYI